MKLKTRQSCGNIPVHKWNAGTYEDVAVYHNDAVACDPDTESCPRNCEGDDWSVDLDNTKFTVSEDGESFVAQCTIKRSFA